MKGPKPRTLTLRVDKVTKAEVRAVVTYIKTLQRKYPTLDPGGVILRIYDLKPGIDTVPPWHYHRAKLANEPVLQASRKQMVAMNRKLVSFRTRLSKLHFLGYPLRCQECGARAPGERTVWCPSNCAWATVDTVGRKPTDSLPRKERILEELTRALWPTRPRLRPVPKRNRLGWLPEYAARLADYLGPVMGEPSRGLATYRVVASVLATASGERITTQMVKDHVERRDNTK